MPDIALTLRFVVNNTGYAIITEQHQSLFINFDKPILCIAFAGFVVHVFYKYNITRDYLSPAHYHICTVLIGKLTLFQLVKKTDYSFSKLLHIILRIDQLVWLLNHV